VILVTGASGKTGRAIISALAAHGQHVRGLVHRPEQVDAVRASGVAETVVGDLMQPVDLLRACQGVASIYHICPNLHGDEVGVARRLIDAAVASGVPRFVYHSVLHPQTEAMPHHWQKLRVEEMLLTTSLAYTILQPEAYMQNVLAYWPTIVDDGVYRIPYALTTRLGIVDLADVAEAAARVLTTPGHAGATYELAGRDVLSPVEVAAKLSAALGRPVRAEAVDREAWAEQARRAGMAEYAVATLEKMFAYYERFGFWGNAFVLSQLLARAPATFDDFLRRHVLGVGEGDARLRSQL